MNTKIRIAACMTPVAAAFLLQGCVAALPVAMAGMYALQGFTVFKSFQMAGGGEVKVAFNEETEQVDRTALLKVTKPGVWPENEGEVFIASRLEASGMFTGVITPSTVSQELLKKNRGHNIALLTEAERLRVMREVCDAVGADALIATRDMGSEVNTNFVSFSRSNITEYKEVIMYSREVDKIILTMQMETVMETGGRTGNTQEALQLSGQAVAEKIIALRGA